LYIKIILRRVNKSQKFVPIVLDNIELLVHYYRHQQDALLTKAVNIQRFRHESTALTKRNNQSELWGECRS
ncbi:TPA: hypothetical protein ACHJZ3_005135, partial [Escherichia coli]